MRSGLFAAAELTDLPVVGFVVLVFTADAGLCLRTAAGKAGLAVGFGIINRYIFTNTLAGVIARPHRHCAGQRLFTQPARNGRSTGAVKISVPGDVRMSQQIAESEVRVVRYYNRPGGPGVFPGGELNGLCHVDGQSITAARILYDHIFAGNRQSHILGNDIYTGIVRSITDKGSALQRYVSYCPKSMRLLRNDPASALTLNGHNNAGIVNKDTCTATGVSDGMPVQVQSAANVNKKGGCPLHIRQQCDSHAGVAAVPRKQGVQVIRAHIGGRAAVLFHLHHSPFRDFICRNRRFR